MQPFSWKGQASGVANVQIERHEWENEYIGSMSFGDFRALWNQFTQIQIEYIGSMVLCPMEPIYAKSRQARKKNKFQDRAGPMFADT